MAILLLAGACGPRELDGPPAIRSRWIEVDPQALFEPEPYLERDVRFEWRLDDPAVASAFELLNDDGRARRTAEGIEVPFAARFIRLARDLDLDAAEIHLLEVELAGARRGHVQLFWTEADGRHSADRMIQLLVEGRQEGVIVFDVAAHPDWTGRVGQISVTPTTAPDQTVVVKAIRGVRHRADRQALARLAARPWKVELDDDLRNALLAPPGLGVERVLDVPRDGRLRVAFGVRPRPFEPVGFRVRARKGDESPVVLFERWLGPDSPPGWGEAEIDLPGYAGGQATLVLETIADPDFDLARMLPVWGNPEIVGPGPARPPPNIILISIDTLRADRMSAYGHTRPTTPGLDAWALGSAVRFETVVAPSPWTLPSHISLFSGLDAYTHGFNYSAPAGTSVVTLAERLREAGYSTAAFTAGAYLSPKFGLAQGFDVFRTRNEGPGAVDSLDELERGIAELRAWVTATPHRPFFAFLHTYAVHIPYRVRQPYFDRFGGTASRLPLGTVASRALPVAADDGFLFRKEFVLPGQEGEPEGAPLGEEERELIGIAYDSGVAYMDHHVSRFLADLAATGLDSDTVIVFTSDHGEMLGEHGLAEHRYLYDQNLLVPLILALPGARGGGTVVSDQVRLIDVFPTLMELAGLEPGQAIDGESLLPLLAGPPPEGGQLRHRDAWSYAALTNYGLSLRHADRLKYVFRNAVWPAEQGREALFDLRRDPGELENLATMVGRTPALRAEATRYLRTRSPGLRVRLTNPGPAAFSGTIEGPMVQQNGVTSPDISCQCVRWLGSGKLGYELPAGTEVTIRFEQAREQRMDVEGRLADGGPAAAFLRTIDLGSLDSPFEVSYSGIAWGSAASAQRGTGARVRVWWQGERGVAGEVPVEDEALRERLRALGYLN